MHIFQLLFAELESLFILHNYSVELEFLKMFLKPRINGFKKSD